MDYSTPIDQPIIKRFITRHRLEKKDPKASMSEAKEPIVYYLDPGTPEPVRSALLEGASWWNQAFEAIGYKNGFQVKMLPEDADPLDLRYNVIQWVHRSYRGWSLGTSITDPRTGEIIKGNVILGSQRIRQDMLIFEGLIKSDRSEKDKDPIELSLARIRQLAAHEVGHTLGFVHNFSSSAYMDRASVMDYPAPLVNLFKDGDLDFSKVYASGVGSWDVFAVQYAYSQFMPKQNEENELTKLINKMICYFFLYKIS